ncbi:MAG: glycogen/starch/alpha-glucan phosphorylase [Paracoccaceae bacterium]|nr:glycogen/starch/alpha-glucan phosphorylase [Paracoccaceae bacterium]
MTPAGMRDAILKQLKFALGKDAEHAQVYDWRTAVSLAIRDQIVEPWFAATRETYARDHKRVYYLSMEFLIGRLLQDAIVNLGLLEVVEGALVDLGLSLEDVLYDEPDAALGNGGLGRLAACFLESLSTIGCPAYGYGIRYEHGLFRQSFLDGRQFEDPEDWLLQRHAWEFDRPEVSFHIGFGGDVSETGKHAVWTPNETVMAQAFDTPIVGWRGRWANTLRLWGALPEKILDLESFNRGDYAGAARPEALARTISRVLYPDDTTAEGKELRLKQEFFFTAASLRDILRRYLSDHTDLTQMPKHVAIQLNDTHPAIAGPELVRLLCDEHGMEMGDAIVTAQRCLSYTNHTLLPEALERWSEGLMTDLLPRHMQIIERIDDWHARNNPDRAITVVEHGEVKMGELSFVMAHKVNGVSALHTGLMKKTVFQECHRLHPERIVNQTNGVTPRRWLNTCNPGLSALITDTIGDGWVDDLEQLQSLEPHIGDAGFLDTFASVKRANKLELAGHISDRMAIDVDPDAMFDIQIKRIHEYKRQHLNILETIAHWHAIRDNPNGNWVPRVKIFGGKAAPGYVLAKEIIHLINRVGDVLNADPVTSPFLKVVYLPNYNVTAAERMIPAADLSEQISTAGKEASGTGNMKFALNGALTIGTLDGANVEIRERVGPENFFLFGMTADEVVTRRAVPDHAKEAIRASTPLTRAIDEIDAGTFSPEAADMFRAVTDDLKGADYFLVCSDFADYYATQRAVDAAFRDPANWMRKAALNTARSGWFSSDRAIRGYMTDIWGAKSAL